ncbi:rust resistance kinase Lr10-like isoform X2 [Macadamia integrifolia]|uniref:rust resistance kinase Lr10-like isoform X2 n=1 Tax=Macadamia integrifolia TaxID=60698 RepID=UPI001C50092C|nr:rust resistance kinase Lr10-like isoform X2 [Macadamia integrifolia]
MQTSMVFVSFFLFFAVAISSSKLAATKNECMLPSKPCSNDGPDIRFPFWIKGQHPEHCGYPGFAVSCTSMKQTLLKLPFSGSFFVRSINYASQTLALYDPDGCLPQKLLHLNLSASPFLRGSQQPDYEEQITFLNCSATEPERDIPSYYGTLISCLGVPRRQVYAFSYLSPLGLPLSFCKKIKTIDVLYLFSDLTLSWSQPSCGSTCEVNGSYCRLKNNSNRSGPETTECFTLPKSTPPPVLDTSAKNVLTGVIIGFFLFVVAMMISIKHYHEYKSDKIEKQNQVRILKFLDDYKALKPSRYTFADIKRITNQFKEKLGQGGYGSVYKGKLSNEILVAVKVLINNSTRDGEDFINEVATIGTIHHINVVRLVGFCADGYRRALVYEFLPNESLEKFIFSRNTKRPLLGWEKLQDIAIGIAKGIEYLHQGCELRILHFDIKPHNILLDDNFNPKISDFGLAKLFSKDESAISMTAARGTIGYIAPEVFSRNFGHVSHKSDVYSFGIMLLEMVGGRKNIDSTVENSSQVYFSQWIYNHLSHGKELEIRIDEDGDASIAKKLTIVALWCIQWYPVDRPSMKVVVQMLEGDRESLIMPPNPFDSTMPSNTKAINSERPLCMKLPIISE